MHLLLIHQVFVSPGEAGGTRHFELARHWVKSGHQFTIVASDLNYLTGKPVAKGQIKEQLFEGIRVLRAKTYPALHRSFTWRVISFVSFMFSSFWAALRAGPVDVVMATSPPIFQAVSAWLVSAIRRRPLLLEIRDLWPEFAIDMGVLTNLTLIRLSQSLEKFFYNRATHILVNSPAYRVYLLNKGILDCKISVIPNGVDPAMFNPLNRGEMVRTQFKLDGNYVVTYAGALGIANDIPTILRAANLLRHSKEIHFLLVGDGKERLNLEQMGRDLQLPNVTFAGALPKGEIPDVLAASDVCLATLQNIPMFKTVFPNKVFDYMAAGRPTILGIDGVIREVIENAKGGIFIEPGNEKALADAVMKLKNDPELSRQMGKAARDHVVKHYNRHLQAEDFRILVQTFRRS